MWERRPACAVSSLCGGPGFCVYSAMKGKQRETEARKLAAADVPCNGCTLCCQGDAVRLEAEDRALDYQTEPDPYIPGALMIAHKPNGDCIYLTEKGCRIHDRAPSLCRSADCRSLALKIEFEVARNLHLQRRLDLRVWDQGHKLLDHMTGKRSP